MIKLKKRYVKIMLVFSIPIIFSILAVTEFIYHKDLIKVPDYNIILISFDTLRADHLSCYGYKRKTSPNIDHFSKDSVIFKNAISQAPLTTASHMSIFTALSPLVHRVHNIDSETLSVLDNKIKTLPEILSNYGFKCVAFTGGSHVAPEFGFGRGFIFYNTNAIAGRNPSTFRPEVVFEWLRRNYNEKFFLFLHTYICHDPYLPPEPYNKKFDPDYNGKIPSAPSSFYNQGRPINPREAFWKNVDYSNREDIEHIIALYDGEISFADNFFGGVIEQLKMLGIYDKSTIVFTSDHGEEFLEHGGTLHEKLFRETLHVPLIIKFPQSEFNGKQVNTPVRLIDIMPTIFEILHIPCKDKIQGTSLLPYIKGIGNELLIFSFRISDPFRNNGMKLKDISIQMGRWKYYRGKIFSNKEWLFDIKKDVGEQNNLKDRRPDLIKLLRKEALRISFKHGKLRKTILVGKRESKKPLLNKETQESLKSLGYLH